MNLARKRYGSHQASNACEPYPAQKKANNWNHEAPQNAAALISDHAHEITKISHKQTKYEQNELKGLEMSAEVRFFQMQNDNDEIETYLDLMESSTNKINKIAILPIKTKNKNDSTKTTPPNTNPAIEHTVNEALKSFKGQPSSQNPPQLAFKEAMGQAYFKQEETSFLYYNQHDIQPKKQIPSLYSSFYQNNCRNLQKENIDRQKNQAFREHLQCSIQNFDIEQKIVEHPYFKISIYGSNTPSQPININKIKNQHASQNPQSDRTKNEGKVPNKKLTLRDYMYISQLSENRQKATAMASQPKSCTRQNSRKKKSQASKGEVLVRIKEEISQSIKKIQQNLNAALKFVEEDRQITNQQEQIIKMYNLCRIIKEQMVGHSEQVVNFMNSTAQ